MSKRIAPIPKGYRTVTPELVVRGADAALTYYKQVFEATELSRVTADDGLTVLQADVRIGNSIIRVTDEMPAFGILSPINFGGTPIAIHIYHAEADRLWERALAHDAGILVPLADTPWGERYGKLIDPFGHVWSISHRIAKLSAQPVPSTTAAETNTPADISDTLAFSVHEPRADNTNLSTEQEAVLSSEEAVSSKVA